MPAPPPEAQSRDEAWALVAPHRSRLVAVARARGLSVEDAQDAAHHVMCRAVERGCLDPERVDAYLVRAVINRCHDVAEDASRQARLLARSAGDDRLAGPVEDTVCDKAQVAWLLAKLPPRERRCVELSAQGETVTAIAAKTGLSYPTVDRLLSRARKEMRRLAAPVVLAAGALWRHRRLAAPPATAAVAVASVTLLVLPSPVPRVAPAEAQEVTRRVATAPRRTPAVRPVHAAAAPAPPAARPPAAPPAAADPAPAATAEEDVLAEVADIAQTGEESAVDRLAKCVKNGLEPTIGRRGGVVCQDDTKVIIDVGRT